VIGHQFNDGENGKDRYRGLEPINDSDVPVKVEPTPLCRQANHRRREISEVKPR